MGKHGPKADTRSRARRDVPALARTVEPRNYISLWLETEGSSLLERVVKRKQVFKRGEHMVSSSELGQNRRQLSRHETWSRSTFDGESHHHTPA
jgi:hypothetical protein